MNSRLPTPQPTSQEVAKLLSFLPKLSAEGFEPILRWHGGPGGDGETATMPYPEYDELVREFFRVASAECWRDYDYRPADARRMLADPDLVGAADLPEIRTMLTYCVRGERFCDGHWGAVIEEGHIGRVLRRIAEMDPAEG